jgi:hypothetical protein
MKIVNNTVWRTDHLKAILQKAAEIELEPAKRKVLHVTVSYTRGGSSSGCAYVGGRHAWIRIRHPESQARRHARYLHVADSDPRPAQGRWSEPDGTSGKVVREMTKGLTPEAHDELLHRFASVAVHEFAHIRGMNHDKMPAFYKWTGSWREYVAWVKGMPLAVKTPTVIVKPTVDLKLAHVLKMKALAETRVKRATTILRKWKTRERYYLKAAQKAQQRSE